MNVVLTTHPAHRSANVGDALITSSVVRLIASRLPGYQPTVLFRETDLDETLGNRPACIVAPGFSVSNGVYRKLYRLHEDLGHLANFYPLGCSFQGDLEPESLAETFRYDAETRAFLGQLAQHHGAFPCRDAMIVEGLHTNGLPAVLSGDMALFDDRYFGVKPERLSDVQSLVFTIGHHPRYADQALRLLTAMKRMFPDARRFVSLHSRPSAHSLAVESVALEMGYESLHLYGDAGQLDAYDQIDLHVGYRLHGHIAFLRRRRPSFLMVEDIRAYGFSRTPGFEFGCVSAFSSAVSDVDEQADEKMVARIQDQVGVGFADCSSAYAMIDRLHASFILPYFSGLVRNIQLHEAGFQS